MGVGRASYEGGNRATYADVFKTRAVEAFAGQLVAQGIASTTAYFVCSKISHVVFTGLNFGTCLAGTVNSDASAPALTLSIDVFCRHRIDLDHVLALSIFPTILS